MITKPIIELDSLLPKTLGVQIAKTFTARLGDPSQNYKVKVDTTDKKGLLYIHGIGDNPNGAYTAENIIGLTELTPQSLVKVGYSDTNRFEVLGVASENSEFMDGVNVNDQVPVNRSQILDGNIITNDSATVQYIGTFYIVDGDSIYRTTDQVTGNLIDGSTNDTSATAIDPPSTANTAIMVLIQINPSTNTLSYKQSAEFPASYSNSLIASGGFFPAPDEDNAISGYVKLINGVTTLKQEHLIQLPDMYRVGGSGGGASLVTSIDQSGGTSDTYGVLSGTLNGSNTTFTVASGIYTSGTLEVYLNGQLQTQGSSEDWTETTPASGTFDFITAPSSTDEITARYSTGDELSSVTTDIVLTKTANYTVLGTEATRDIIILADATAGDMTITFPTASSYQNRRVIVKKTDSTSNTVTLDGNGSETIDSDLTKIISGQYTSITNVSSGSNWSII